MLKASIPILFVCKSRMYMYVICESNYVEIIKSLTQKILEPPHGKTNNLHRRKQRCRSASRSPRS